MIVSGKYLRVCRILRGCHHGRSLAGLYHFPHAPLSEVVGYEICLKRYADDVGAMESGCERANEI